MPRDWLTPDEADTVMANIPPGCRSWGCRPIPGEAYIAFGCACPGCIGGALSWDEFVAWEKREAEREPTPHIELVEPKPLDLQERLALYKYQKRTTANNEAKP
jgi:hypothetical protein